MTMINRRNILKSTASVAAVVGVGGLASAQGHVGMMLGESFVASDVPKYPFKWWVSLDGGEVFQEPYDTAAEAIKAACEHGGGLVAECQRQDYDLRVNGDSLLELLYDQNEDKMGEDAEFIEPTSEQVQELGDEVTKVVAAWAKRNKIDTSAWQFGEVRNKELVVPTDNPFHPLLQACTEESDEDPLYLAQEG